MISVHRSCRRKLGDFFRLAPIQSVSMPPRHPLRESSRVSSCHASCPSAPAAHRSTPLLTLHFVNPLLYLSNGLDRVSLRQRWSSCNSWLLTVGNAASYFRLSVHVRWLVESRFQTPLLVCPIHGLVLSCGKEGRSFAERHGHGPRRHSSMAESPLLDTPRRQTGPIRIGRPRIGSDQPFRRVYKTGVISWSAKAFTEGEIDAGVWKEPDVVVPNWSNKALPEGIQ
jgi:hypothetical protein